MSKRMASILLVYGILLALFSFVTQQVAPALARIVFITGIAGGGLCVVWGLVALAGHKRRIWAVLSMIATTIVLLTHVVPAWMSRSGEAIESVAWPILLTFMLLLSIAMLMYLVHGERPPEFYSPGTARRDIDPSEGGRDRR